MSGLCGIIFKDAVSEDLLRSEIQKASAAIEHRGLEHKALYSGDRIAISCRQYENGAYDTDAFADDNIVVAIDGALRGVENLMTLAKVSEDTGVAQLVSVLYQTYGRELVKHLDGSFSIFIFDKKTNHYFVARDKLAFRPLYFYLSEHLMMFGSEVKSFLDVADVSLSTNSELLYQALTYGATIGPETLFEDVYKATPGVIYDGGFSGEVNDTPFVFGDNSPRSNQGSDFFGKKIWENLGNNIRVQSGRAKRLGLFLSSGIDSTLVAVKQSQMGYKSSLAIGIGYSHEEAKPLDESAVAEENAEKFNMDFAKVEIGQEDDLVKRLSDIVWKMEEPTRFAIAIPMEKAFCKYGSKMDILLTGMYADDLFGTDEHYFSPYYTFRNKLSPAVKKLVEMFLSVIKRIPKLRRLEYLYNQANYPTMRENVLADYKFNRSLFGLVQTENTDEIAPRARQHYSQYRSSHPENEWALVGHLMIFYNWNELFEILGSHSGIDIIYPFISKSMYDLSNKMPLKLKVNGKIVKPCLRKLAEEHISKEHAYRKKVMFGSPEVVWMSKSEQLENYIVAFRSDDCLLKQYLDAGAINRLVDNFEKQRKTGKVSLPLTRILFSLVELDQWLKQFIHRK